MADSCREEKVSIQDLDDSLCEEDLNQTQMQQQSTNLLTLNQNVSGNNNCDETCILNCASANMDSISPKNLSSISLHYDESTQKSPSVLTNTHILPRNISFNKMKPVFGKKSRSNSFSKVQATKDTLTTACGDQKKKISSMKEVTDDKNVKEALGDAHDVKDEFIETNSSASKVQALDKEKKNDIEGTLSEGHDQTDGSIKINFSASKKQAESKEKKKVLKLKKVSLSAKEKVLQSEQKKKEEEARKKEKEQKMVDRERKRKEQERMKEEKKQKSLLLKAQRGQKKADLEKKKRKDKFMKSVSTPDKQPKKEPKCTGQSAKDEQTKVTCLKKLDGNGAVKDLAPVSDDLLEKNVSNNVGVLPDLKIHNAVHITNVSNPSSPSSVLSGALSDDCSSHSPFESQRSFSFYLTSCNSVPPPNEWTSRDSPVVQNPKRRSTEGAYSEEVPKPKKSKIDDTDSEGSLAQAKSSCEMEQATAGGPCPQVSNDAATSPQGTDSSQQEPRVRKSNLGNVIGPVWVKCSNVSCQKWRQLKDHFDPLTVPAFWNCTNNSDVDRNDCTKPMERWDNYENDDYQFVESTYGPGSMVWAKLDSFPWYSSTDARFFQCILSSSFLNYLLIY